MTTESDFNSMVGNVKTKHMACFLLLGVCVTATVSGGDGEEKSHEPKRKRGPKWHLVPLIQPQATGIGFSYICQ